VAVGESVTVLGRASSGNWLYVRHQGGTEGFVWLPYFSWSGDLAALPTRQASDDVTPATSQFTIDHRGCLPHGSTLGSVKGQVFDRSGNIIVGAMVEIWIDGAPWVSPANPARTNQDGWYEWTLGIDQTVRFVKLYVNGRQVSFSPLNFEVKTQSGCFQQVNFRQR